MWEENQDNFQLEIVRLILWKNANMYHILIIVRIY